MTALERDAEGRPSLVETENDIKIRRMKSRVRIRYEGPERLSWTQEKGDMKSVEAVWELRSRHGRTRATTGSTRFPAGSSNWSFAGRWRQQRDDHRQWTPRRAQAACRGRLT